MTYAVIDLRARTMTYARAGHTPLIYVPGAARRRRRGRCRSSRRTGWCVGLKLDNGEMFERHLVEETIPLQPGDLYLLFTDGISEAMNARDDLFGEARLGPARRDPRAPAVGGAARARAARDRGVRRRRAAARRHDDDPAEGRRARRGRRADRARSSRNRRVHAMIAAASGGFASTRCDRSRRHLPHPLRHRSADRPRPARDPRRDVGRLVRTCRTRSSRCRSTA